MSTLIEVLIPSPGGGGEYPEGGPSPGWFGGPPPEGGRPHPGGGPEGGPDEPGGSVPGM
jgi:hypothetical protein